MKTVIVAFLMPLLVAAIVFAAPVGVGRKPASAFSNGAPDPDGETLFEINVLYGEKLSSVALVQKGTQHLVVYAATEMPQKTVEVSPRSASYLMRKAETISPAAEITANCYRTWIQLTISPDGMAPVSKSACLNSNSAAAKELRRLADLMATMI